MKRIALIMALFLIMTMSGVYAAWTYTSDNAEVVDKNTEALILMAEAETDNSLGSFSISTNLKITVDQANDNHEAMLVFESQDGKPIHLTITFTPSLAASQTIKENGIDSELYFKTTTVMEYPMDAEGNYSASGTPAEIFSLSNEADGVFTPNVDWGTPDENGVFTVTYDQAALESMITLAETFKLDTKVEHDRFGDCLTGNIKAYITDGTVDEEIVG